MVNKKTRGAGAGDKKGGGKKAGKIDVHDMRGMILGVPRQLAEVAQFGEKIELDVNPENIVACGMGGSATAGEFLAAYVDDFIDLPVFVHRDYGLPKETTERSLVLVSSYSGNTEEAISSYEEAAGRGLAVAVASTDGKLGELCQKNGTPWVEIPATGMQPRLGYGYNFAALAKILSDSGIISSVDADLQATADELLKINGDESGEAELEDHGRRLGKLLKGKMPIVYTSRALEFVGYAWKTKLNENAKVMAYNHSFPELNHNEINAYQAGASSGDGGEGEDGVGAMHFVFIRDKHDNPEIIRRMKVTMELIEGMQAGTYSMVELDQENPLARYMAGFLLGDWASYYLALERGVDPYPVEVVEKFKEALRESRV